MRRILLSGLVALLPTFAFADESISGQWLATIDSNKQIEMDVLADGHWYSKNIENDKIVRELSGSYDQTVKTPTTGTLVFKPDETVKQTDNSTANVETDEYVLSDDKKSLKLTANGDTMEYTRTDTND